MKGCPNILLVGVGSTCCTSLFHAEVQDSETFTMFLRPLLARFHGEKLQSHDFGMTSGSSGAMRKKGWGMT